VDPRLIRDAYDKSAKTYDARFAALQAPKYDAVLARMDVTGRVADLGGGTGLLLARLGRAGVLVDFSLPMLQRSSAPQRVQADLRALPLRDGAIDRAFAITSLLLPGAARLAALREVARILAPGGRAAITVLREEQAGLEEALRAAGLVPGPRFDCGQDFGWIAARA
jgi:ubiquinone/menaquinone biosynthesis C-methylase UbiE